MASVSDKMSQIRKHFAIPVGVGFGIKDADSAASVAKVADAVVVGSAIVNKMAEHAGNTDKIIENVTDLLGAMRVAMDATGAKKITTA